MNAVTTTEPVSAQTLEHVLGTGDLSKLSTQQRVEYYAKTCESLGLNPLTRPMRFLSLNGQIQLYFTRDGTDQLRKAQGITLHVVDRVAEAGVYSVTVRARDKHGREDEDIGAVVLPQGGESRANALMKAITKAKRRVTLSICGLGQTDESELDTMPGARVFDAEDEPPAVPIRTVSEPGTREAINDAVPMKSAALDMQRGARIAEKAPAYEAPPKSTPAAPRTDVQWNAWVDKLEAVLATLSHRGEQEDMIKRPEYRDVIAGAPQRIRRDIDAILAATYERLPPLPDPEDLSDEALGEVEIAGADKVGAG